MDRLRAGWLRRARWAAALAGALLLAACGGGGGAGGTEQVAGEAPPVAPGAALQTTWSAAMNDYNQSAPGLPVPPPRVFENQTLRQTLHVTAGGQALRVLVSNVFGREPLVLVGAHVARHAGGTAIEVESDTPLTFRGQPGVTVPAGAEVWSDEVSFELAPRSNLTVSVYVAGRAPAATWHAGAFQRGGIVRGNALSAPDLVNAEETLSIHWVSRIDVRTAAPGGVIVALGDSLTEGALSTVGANRRYPDALDRRVAADASLAGMAVVNAGIGGNRLLLDGFGPRALDRFDRDVAQVTNVRGAIVLIGINDLHAVNAGIGPDLSSEEMTKGYAELIRRSRALGLRIWLATLPPCRGNVYASDATEAKRQALNAWIRSQTLADGVVDFDAALRDPQAPQRLNPAYDSGDALHPNDAGMAAMAQAVDLALLARR